MQVACARRRPVPLPRSNPVTAADLATWPRRDRNRQL